jgi:hypothetical protein
VLFSLLSKDARTKKSECRALVVNEHISNLRYQFKPLPAALFLLSQVLIEALRRLSTAPLAVRRRYLIVVRRSLPRCASRVLDRGAQSDARGASQVLDGGAKAVARGAARCEPQVFDRDLHANARGAPQ